MFSKEIYTKRRNELKLRVQKGLVLLPGNVQSSMNFKDNWYPFRQDSTFLYYSGIDIPNIFLLIDIDNDEEILFGNDPTPEEIVWIGDVDPLATLAEKTGVDIVKPVRELESYLEKVKGREIHHLPPYRPEPAIQLSDLLYIPLQKVEANASETLIRAVVGQRSIKSEEEIIEIEKAVNITSKMHLHAIKNALPGRTEKEVAGELQAIAIGGGGNISFPIILTKNGQYLHNHPTEVKLAEGDLVLCDAGAETSLHYAGDMTRTFPVSGRFTDLQKNIYNIVLDAHNSAIQELRPGVLFKDIHLLACKRLSEGLKDIGLMKGDMDEAVASGAHTLFFQCGLGHMMGLDVHDMENLGEQYVGYTNELIKSKAFGMKSLRLGKALEEGFVLTVEPGIYFNPYLIDSWKVQRKFGDFIDYNEVEKFKSFGGIRVEEDFLITSLGNKLIGEPFAKSPEEIEQLKAI